MHVLCIDYELAGPGGCIYVHVEGRYLHSRPAVGQAFSH